MTPSRTSRGVALLVLLGFGLAGCSTTGVTPPPATSTGTVTVSAAPSPATSAPATPPTPVASSAPSVDPAAPAGQCADSALAVSVQHDPTGDGAGQRHAFVVFTNTGSSPCVLQGAPGLSLVGGADGRQIGDPAQRSTAGVGPVSIAPGRYALAGVGYTFVDQQGGNFGDGNGHDPQCRAKATDGYRISPPHSFRAFFSASKTYACSTAVHWISVNAVQPASSASSFHPRLP